MNAEPTKAEGSPRIASAVALGGGHGLATVLRSLHGLARRITAIVGVADDGGSSGRLRQEVDVLPPGDLRMAVSALSEAGEYSSRWTDVLQHRFESTGDLAGHALGNLLLVAAWQLQGEPVKGLNWLLDLLCVPGKVLPCSLTPLEIVAEIRDHVGTGGATIDTVSGQVQIATTAGTVQRIWLEPVEAAACPSAIREIHKADMIILGPGSWFTSVLPHLVLPDLARALVDTSAIRILVLNLAQQKGETTGLSSADLVSAILRHASEMRFDHVIADQRELNMEDARKVDDVCHGWGAKLHVADVTASRDRHDPAKLRAVFDSLLAGC